MPKDLDCPFCGLFKDGLTLAVNEHAFAFRDAYPLSEGHLLVVPKAHEPDFLSLNTETQQDIFTLAVKLADDLRSDPGITGVNFGINAGASAGQTVEHAHLHVIPRRDGDVEDPKGGIRWVLPEKAKYWSD